jgi:muconate cycloisomerase
MYRIREIATRIVDLPIRREHRIGVSTMRRQSSVIVQVFTEDGPTGLGEGVVPGGGPAWGGESVDSIKVTIDRHLAPALIDVPLTGANEAAALMRRVSAGNHFAKAAVEMALWDIAGKAAGLSVHELLGGRRRESMDVLWSVGANVEDPAGELAEFAGAGHRTVKFMMGGRSPQADVERVRTALHDLPTGLTVVVDASGRWDEPAARRLLPALAEAGVDIAEQLVPAWNLDAMARLTGLTRVWTLADEAVRSASDALRVAIAHSADIIALKVPKLGGIAAARDVAAVTRAAGLRCYAGGTMETSIGTSAAVQLFSTLPELAGCDLIGPLMLADDVVTRPLEVRGGALAVPQGAGLGVELDEDKIRNYVRE